MVSKMGISSENKRPSIAILGSRGVPAKYGGFETIAQDLGASLAREGFEVYVSCESQGLKIKPYGQYEGMRLVYFPVTNWLRSISEFVLYDLLSVLWATSRVDVIYMLGYSSVPTLLLPKLFRKVVLVNVDGLEAARPKFSPLVRYFYRSFEKLVTKVADFVVVDSKTMGVYYQKNYRIAPIYIPNGGGCTRDIMPFDSAVLKSYNLQKGQYYLFIARLTPDNSIDFIIDAFKKTNSRKKLVIVGPIVQNSFVDELLANKGERIVFLGGVYEPRLQRTLRHNCFAYIHGHRMGGTSVSLIEAMSCKNNILAMNTVCNREVAEKSAIYFTRDVNDLKEKIEALEKNPLQANREAYRLYKEKYSADNILFEFANLVNKVATREKTRAWNDLVLS
jgi:glycosyltransferase involved in cell wall biosynthesis